MYLVTGGAGFIGSHLVANLVRRGMAVRVLDDFSSGVMANLAPVRSHIDLIEGDVRDAALVRRALDGITIAFHLAAQPSVSHSIADPATTIAVNVSGTLNLLEAARDAGSKRLVFASTCAVYGDTPELPKREDMIPAPLSPYAASKLMGEHLCAIFGRTHGLETVALRYFNVFGPRQDPASAYAAAIPRFLAALHAGSSPVVYGDGGQTRDFVAVDDVVTANLQAASMPGISGRVFNVARGERVSINEVIAAIARQLGTDVPVRYEPARPGDIRHSSGAIDQTRARLRFVPRVSLEAGLAQVIAATIPVAQIRQQETTRAPQPSAPLSDSMPSF